MRKPATPNLPAALIEAVYFKPWLITGPAHATLRARVDAMMAGRTVEFLGMEFQTPGMHIREGIAIVPIKGTIGRGFSGMDQVELILGNAVDSETIAEELIEADNHDGVDAVLLDIDSPGGMVNGTPELADMVAGMNKPVYAYSAGMMASAAYWLGASAAGGVWGTRSADFGSIGVYQLHLDYSRIVDAAGINAELFKTGEFKAMGHPYFALTDNQRGQLQMEVDSIFVEFAEWVTQHRPGVQDDTMQGQTFMGEAAVEAGLVDALVRDRREMLEMIREDIGAGSDYSLQPKQRTAPVATTQAASASAAQPLFLTVNVEGQQPKKKAVTFQRDESGAVIGMKAEDTD